MQADTAAANDLQVRFSIGDRKMETRKARALSIAERLLWGIPVGKRYVFYERKAARRDLAEGGPSAVRPRLP